MIWSCAAHAQGRTIVPERSDQVGQPYGAPPADVQAPAPPKQLDRRAPILKPGQSGSQSASPVEPWRSAPQRELTAPSVPAAPRADERRRPSELPAAAPSRPVVLDQREAPVVRGRPPGFLGGEVPPAVPQPGTDAAPRQGEAIVPPRAPAGRTTLPSAPPAHSRTRGEPDYFRGPSPGVLGGAPRPREGAPVEPGREVERVDLAPVAGARGTADAPQDAWRGLTVAKVEELVSGLPLPPRSGALHGLWRRLLSGNAPGPTGGKTPSHGLALRMEALYRAGLLADMDALANNAGAMAADPIIAILRAKAQLGLGQADAACASSRTAKYEGDVPKDVARDALLLIAYCSAVAGNAPAAGLTIDLARERGLDAPFAFSLVDRLVTGDASPVGAPLPKTLTLIEFKLWQLAKLPLAQGILERAEPALVVALSVDGTVDPDLRLSAAEVAASAHAIGAKELADAYRIGTAQGGAAGRRAQLYQAVLRERSGARRTQAMKALLDEARRNALFVPIARMLVDDVRSLRQDQETVAFAETAIEIALAAGDYPMAVGWAIFGSSGDRRGGGTALLHWFTLVDVAGGGTSIPPGSGHKFVEDLAAAGRVSPQFLHRLITVLDAIGAGIPAGLWQSASRVPQPMDGYLPPTGVLPALGEAARNRHFGLTVLLAVRALGPDGAEGASPLALTDTIRALESAGLKTEARRVAFEALFSGWPRAGR